MNTFLSTLHVHERDANIVFEETGHKYTINGDPTANYMSVTTWNHTHFHQFNATLIIKNMMKGKNWNETNKYWGMTEEEIKKQWSDNGQSVAQLGTDMHFKIECFMNMNINNVNKGKKVKKNGFCHKDLLKSYKSDSESESESDEWKYFIQFVRDHPELKPYRTEWVIYHEELKLAGSIDMVYENPDGTLMIYDWKRSKEITKINTFKKFAKTKEASHIPDTNFWHYSLQLNTYKAIIEAKYGKKVTYLCLVRLHPNAQSYELMEVPDMSEDIATLFALRKNEIN